MRSFEITVETTYGAEALDIEAVIAEYNKYGERLSKFIGDVSVLTYEAAKADKKILFEDSFGNNINYLHDN